MDTGVRIPLASRATPRGPSRETRYEADGDDGRSVPLISKVGRKRPRALFALATVYVILTVGGLTMVYPFLLMSATGMKGPTDYQDNRLIPEFWRDREELFKKYVDDKYFGNVDLAAPFYGEAEALRAFSPTKLTEPLKPKALDAATAHRYERFLLSLPNHLWEPGFRLGAGRIHSRLTQKYLEFLRTKFSSIEELNKAYLEENLVFQTVVPPTERYASKEWKPLNDQKWKDWTEFKQTLPAEFRIPITKRGLWQYYLRSTYRNRINNVPPEIRRGAGEFSEIEPDESNPAYRKWMVEGIPEIYRRDSADARWQAVSGSTQLPVAAYDRYYVEQNSDRLKREFSSRNYSFVLDYIMIHGRAVWNTALFCFLAIATQLIVNPLAAYALSRYPIKATGKLLLFLLATMAFPAEVTMIPGFLLLRDLGLLNTFAALVLPMAASGYSIYLLKGFFDSLPRDLYESGSIEGAKETTLFAKITLPMSKPVLAVIALHAFMAAYGAFLFAFLVAQDQRMWTLMVWIYQLQSRAPKYVMMAALTVAAIPTLAVFLAAQRVILRGLILPGEK